MSFGQAPQPSAAEIIRLLDLKPHPEGGHYRETFRDDPGDGRRGVQTAIYYLLQAGELSAWHRVTDAVELWHWYAGGPLALTLSPNGHDAEALRGLPAAGRDHRLRALA